MTNPINLVRRFHEAFNHPVRDTPTPLDDATLALRLNLIDEEVDELFAAIHNGDLVEIADALGDIVYVTIGMALCEGVSDRLPVYDDCNVNMGGPALDLSNEDIPYHANMIQVAIDGFAGGRADIEDTLYLSTILDHAYQLAWTLGIKLTPVIEEIHESNMTKLQEDGTAIYNEFGKVMKPDTYVAPDIALVLEGQKRDAR